MWIGKQNYEKLFKTIHIILHLFLLSYHLSSCMGGGVKPQNPLGSYHLPCCMGGAGQASNPL